MNVQIQAVQPGTALQERLEKNGWKVRRESDGTLVTSHRFVMSEPEARWRLHQMGMLTSRQLRIQFLVPGLRPSKLSA